MSQKLEAAAKGKVERIAVQDADHNNLFEIGGDEMFEKIGEFVQQVTSRK